MNTHMHPNSIETYKGILDRLPDRRAAVFRVIAAHGPLTRNDIAEILCVPINEVTGRVDELRKAELVREGAKVKTKTNRPRSLLEAVPPQPVQGRLAL